MGTMWNSSLKPDTPQWRTMLGASKRTILVVDLSAVLPTWPTPISSLKRRSVKRSTLSRLNPRESRGGMDPSCSQ